MSVSVKISRDFSKLSAELTEEDMRDVGDLLVRRIRTRTENGQDVRGNAFRRYSTMYAKRKRAALGHERVDLTVSGQMLNDMHVTETTPQSATISFVSQGAGVMSGGTLIQQSLSMGSAQKAVFNNPSREFFAASEEDEEAIVDSLDRLLTKRFAGGE